MSEAERLENIKLIAMELSKNLVTLSLRLAEKNYYVEDLQKAIYQAGFIEGLSYVIPKEEK